MRFKILDLRFKIGPQLRLLKDILLLCVGLFALVAGCATPTGDMVALPKPRPYTAKIETVSAHHVLVTVEQLAAQHGATAFILLEDGEYFVPEHRWVCDLFGQWLPRAIEALNLQYAAESWDCDDYADLATMGARLALADKRARVTIARVSLEPPYKGAQRHQIVGFLSDQGLYFCEPQPHLGVIRIWPPSAEELARVYRVNLRSYEVEVQGKAEGKMKNEEGQAPQPKRF